MIHVVSYSEISTFRQCAHKWEKEYRERWTSSESKPALEKGTLFHAVLENHYLAMRRVQREKLALADFPKYVEKKLTPLLYREDGSQSEIQQLIQWMYEGYVEYWAADIDEWTIVAAEHAAEVALPSSLPLPTGKKNEKGKEIFAAKKSNFRLKVKIDILARHNETNKLYVWDHKSGANLPSQKELAIDDQFGLYTWAMRQLGRPVWGSIYNAARTQRNKTDGQTLESRHSRTPLYRLDAELDVIAYEAYLTAKRAYATKEGMAERSPNPDTCKWKCGLLEPCLAGRKGIDEKQFLLDSGFKQIFVRH